MPGPSHYRGFTVALRYTTVGRTPLDEWSARRRDLYLITHSTHKRYTYIPLGGIRTRNPTKRAAADTHLRPRGHWVRCETPTRGIILKIIRIVIDSWDMNWINLSYNKTNYQLKSYVDENLEYDQEGTFWPVSTELRTRNREREQLEQISLIKVSILHPKYFSIRCFSNWSCFEIKVNCDFIFGKVFFKKQRLRIK